MCEQSTWVSATLAKSAKPVPQKAVTLSDCSVFLLAKVAYFYWQTETFIFKVLVEHEEKSKHEEIQ